MNHTYCNWNTTYGEAHGGRYSEKNARTRFEAGDRCTLLVGEVVDQPEVVLQTDLCGARIEVTWLDALQCPELMYLFVVQKHPDWPQDRLLLEQTHSIVYDNDLRPPESRSAWDESFYFKADGSYYGIRGVRDGSDSEETRGKLDAEQLQIQIEPRPVFGDWQSLLRRER